MARLVLILCLLVLSMSMSMVQRTESRKLLRAIPGGLEESLLLSALPKGTTPPSAPSKKGHAVVIDEKLFTMHLAVIDRILRSVPSPGVGH